MKFITKSVAETAEIAFNLGEQLCRRAPSVMATIAGLYGELGSGKTTFMKYLAESFGITEMVQSPTFVIMKIYKIKSEMFERLIHVDAYRIEKEAEMLNLGWPEIIADPKNLICIEWPERISGIMPEHIRINFEHGEKENERKISVT